MKITKRQLKRIIKEEKVKLTEGTGTGTVDIFDSGSMYDLLVDAVEAHLRSHNRSSLRLQEVELMRHALQAAVSNLEDDYS
jgi:hypothetical protein